MPQRAGRAHQETVALCAAQAQAGDMPWSEADIPDQRGRTAIVTGANSGIGWETARALAAKGARVVLGCRNEDKGRDAEQRIRGRVPGADLRFEALDLGSLASVQRFAEKVAAEESRLDLLINNAGVMMTPAGKTTDGFETQLGTNHLGHFALTGRLLERLRHTAGARVVNVSSLVHFTGRIDFDDLQAERSYNPTRAYAQSKLANLLFTRELARRFADAGVAALSAAAHPGSTRTELQRHSRLMAAAVQLVSQLPPQGALPSLYAATAPDVRGGEYFGPSRMFGMLGAPERARSSPRSKDMSAAQRLWEASERLTGVRFAF
jgi:NAD(P)-dependent dehydrogenase (short-subunit alcohol dehydrogenase family)